MVLCSQAWNFRFRAIFVHTYVVDWVKKHNIYLFLSWSSFTYQYKVKTNDNIRLGWLQNRVGALFSKAQETFRARKDKQVCTSENHCMGVLNLACMKQLWIHKVWDFVTAFRVRKHFGTVEKRAPTPLPYNCLDLKARLSYSSRSV